MEIPVIEKGDIIVKDAPDVSQPLTFTTATNSVSMKNYDWCLACLIITDAGTGSAITMLQGTTSTASTSLGFTNYWYKADIATSNAFVAGTASSNTFTTGTSSKTGLYVIPVKGSMLTDTYCYVRLNAASAANATGTLFYIMGHGRHPALPSSVVDASS